MAYILWKALLKWEKRGLFNKKDLSQVLLYHQISVEMDAKEIEQLSDEELLKKVSVIKPNPIFDAFFIGFLVGVILFGIFVSSWGFFTLIPLYLIYIFLKKSKTYDKLQKEMRVRGLQESN